MYEEAVNKIKNNFFSILNPLSVNESIGSHSQIWPKNKKNIIDFILNSNQTKKKTIKILVEKPIIRQRKG